MNPGTKLGVYEIVAPLGAGGMGEVYRARDSRLDRTVAIKILASQLAADPERLRRFELEARAASALNHPNIVTIYDIGQQDGASYLAMELVEGRTLRDLLGSAPIPLKKCLAIAAQVADGLAKAHSAGIVHRDLKPENIMVTSDGLVKILDFGLAKLAALPEASANATATLISATVPGVVLGTVGYMSPEQARGAALDFRSDQFSFGTVLYEMLTNKAPFERASSAQTMAAIIEDDPPPISELNPKTPVAVQWIAERCLAKEPDERYASTRDLARDLQRVRDRLSEAVTGSVLGVSPPAVSASHRWWPVALVVAVVVGFALGALLFRSAPDDPPQLQNLTFSGTDSGPSVSPDGHSIVFTSTRDGKFRIWLKQLPNGAEVPITAGPDSDPRFSRDGAMVAFTHQDGPKNWIYRTSIVGGEPRRLAEGRNPDWSPDGQTIAFLRDREIWLMDSYGGNSRLLWKDSSGQYVYNSLRWSPDGTRLAVGSVAGGVSSENDAIHLLSIANPEMQSVKPAFPGGDISAVDWISNDEVLYARGASFSSVGPINISSSRLIRQKIPSGGGRVLMWLPGGLSTVESAGPGRLVVDLGVSRQNLREATISPGKEPEERWMTRGSSIDRQPRFSPDGEWVVFTSNRSGNLDLWEVSVRTGIVRRLTDDPMDDWDPGFTPDGKLLWTSHRTGNYEIWMAEHDGSSAHQVSHDGVDAENPTATRDGWVIYNSASKHAGLWKVRADGSQASLFIPGINNWPEASPDGHYVLATSIKVDATHTSVLSPDESIAVYRVSDGGEVFRIPIKAPSFVSAGIGRARWAPDGKSILFIERDANNQEGIYEQAFVPGEDTSATRRVLVSSPEFQPETFDISPDGKHLVYAVIETSSNLLMIDGVPGVRK